MHEDLIREFSLEGRVAVVTGGASGLGRETARTFAQAGASLVLADIDEAGMAETAAMVQAIGSQALTRRVDVRERAAVEALADEVVQSMGRVDIWVNAAGVLGFGAVIEMNEAELERIVDTNQHGTYWGCGAAGRVMRPQGRGSIVNISSAGADMCPPNVSVYVMTKSAVSGLTRSAAREFGAFGVRVNAIAPGTIDTPMVTASCRNADGEMDIERRDAMFRTVAASTALNMMGAPRDIALAALYLAADASRFMTGQLVRPNGGVVMPY